MAVGHRLLPTLAIVLVASSGSAVAAQAPLEAHQQLARDIYKELIEINTTTDADPGGTTTAAEAMAARLKAAGFPDADVQVVSSGPRDGNLIARYRGNGATGRKPILLLAHLDVVAARKEDWSNDLDPFTFTERDGYYYGRGTADDKAMAAIWIANLIRMKREGYVPDRDLIVALTADEEGGDHNGVDWLLKNRRELIDAAYALNEGGGGYLKNGKPFSHNVQAAEKVYYDFTWEVRNKGGHSSRPVKDNAIYRLSEALARLSTFEFPVKLNEVTRGYFEKLATVETGQTAADMRAVARNPNDTAAARRLSAHPVYNATMRTTCVATQLEGGHAPNALPQLARATVNCRVLPDHDIADVRETLVRVAGDTAVHVSPTPERRGGPPSPLSDEVMRPVERLTREMWPGIPVVPVMATGATDGWYLRAAGIPTYGVSGLFGDMDDSRAHGRDERMLVKSFFEGQEFLYRLVKELSSRRPVS
ncbi:MAG TPA: M20/M25/M40 family metallo-hydrolase, partial [Gemmatimonadaceae bacterium]|nr:M20/M25/M40 family metallo-hydrolase [Gemmatimonadaceae bacterium]